ncbi:MAG: gliding motility protein RemB [Flavobacteriaceae bacterium]
MKNLPLVLLVLNICANLEAQTKQEVRFDTLFMPEHHSNLRLTFTHEMYSQYDYYMGLDENAHTAVKPYTYKEVQKNLNLDGRIKSLQKDKKSWVGRKLWNEHLFTVKEKDFWFSGDFTVDLFLGKDNSEDIEYTYNNTRIFQVQGGLGSDFSFYTSVFESQARYTSYLNKWVWDNKGADSGGLIPGRGKASGFGEDAYDYTVAQGYVAYSPSKFFDFQLGNGTNFIGEGYRSLLLSDAAAPYTYFKINTTFWRFRYTNIWMFMRDIRRVVQPESGNYARKYVAAHYLSFNVTKNWNIGLYEGVISAGENGMNAEFWNPLLFYTAIENMNGSDAGNSVIGFNSKWVPHKKWHLYGQFMFDEFRLSEIQAGNGWWANKYGFQVGAKHFGLFGIPNLFVQGEYNWVRPYTGSHDEVILNYGHFNQPIAHLWGSNFWEAVGILRYNKGRFFMNLKASGGEKGFDPNVEQSYGGDIYKSYNDYVNEYGNYVGQGNKALVLNADLQTGYVVNPVLNLRLFAGFSYRNFEASPSTYYFDNGETYFFQVGLKSDLFNWNVDF